jgi:hypothetical protein
MRFLTALALAAASARVESVSLTTVDARAAVRVQMSGIPGVVAVHREGDVVRVSLMDAELGPSFTGGPRFSWTPAHGCSPVLGAPACLDRLEVEATSSEVSVILQVQPDVSINLRRDARGFLLVLRNAPHAAEPPHDARSAAPPSSSAAPSPPAAPPTDTAPASPPPVSGDTLELAKRLFPAPAADVQAAEPTGSVADLYPRLFPTGPPQAGPEEAVAPAAVEPEGGQGLSVGPFRVKAGVDARFLDADTFVESTVRPVRDRWLAVEPRVVAETPVGEGRLTLDYTPTFRAFANYDDVNSSSERVGAGVEVPLGPSITLRAKDQFLSGLLESREVDPGGEYFFGLGRFHKNSFDAGASIGMGPRLSAELAGTLGSVRFTQSSTFFDYDTRTASAGLGYELTPNLKAVVAYVYDEVPSAAGRPQAAERAHSGTLTLTGDLLPLLNGQLSVGYRRQDSPNAGLGGTSYSGFTMSGKLVRQLGREANLTLFANRSTPVSAFENNGFYVATALQGTLHVPLPLALQLDTGLGYQWSDYRTVAPEIGQARADRIFGWLVGLRRPIRPGLVLTGGYRHERRRSNMGGFNTAAGSYMVELQWDILGAPPR